jgi:hypothetical protein
MAKELATGNAPITSGHGARRFATMRPSRDGGISSVGRALDCDSRCHRFDPGMSPQKKGPCNQCVTRAFPFLCPLKISIKNAHLTNFVRSPDCSRLPHVSAVIHPIDRLFEFVSRQIARFPALFLHIGHGLGAQIMERKTCVPLRHPIVHQALPNRLEPAIAVTVAILRMNHV